jgi:hypothetical protein
LRHVSRFARPAAAAVEAALNFSVFVAIRR